MQWRLILEVEEVKSDFSALNWSYTVWMWQKDWRWTNWLVYPVGNYTCTKYVYFGVYFLTCHGKDHQQSSDCSVQAEILCYLGGVFQLSHSCQGEPCASEPCFAHDVKGQEFVTSGTFSHLCNSFHLCYVQVKLCRVNLYKVRAIPVFQDRIYSNPFWWGQEGRRRTQKNTCFSRLSIWGFFSPWKISWNFVSS